MTDKRTSLRLLREDELVGDTSLPAHAVARCFKENDALILQQSSLAAGARRLHGGPAPMSTVNGMRKASHGPPSTLHKSTRAHASLKHQRQKRRGYFLLKLT